MNNTSKNDFNVYRKYEDDSQKEESAVDIYLNQGLHNSSGSIDDFFNDTGKDYKLSREDEAMLSQSYYEEDDDDDYEIPPEFIAEPQEENYYKNDSDDYEIPEEYIAESSNKKTKNNSYKAVKKQEYKKNDIEDDYLYDDDSEELEDNSNKIIKIVIIAIIVLFIMIFFAIIDIISVSKYNIGPFFAIPVHTYNDGGTKEYLGLGYKVIKYNQVQGRRDMEIGTWGLKYSVNPIYIDIIDLAIEFNNDEASSVKKYNKQLLVVTGTLKEIDQINNRIVISYEDEGEKYSLNVACNMITTKESLSLLKKDYEMTVMGSMIGYDYKENNRPSTIYLDNCFAQQ